ncbi:flagellar biosynthesis protein FlhA [Pseudooceanicola sp. HF7]|uniref:flagellar biosynthesis protein FlhA n=1 Tax=Pseudooceanicola sp. HF7 TaxID=2721560 RepID=UPI001432114A|nr:flagellar biosynthesis protein FlhA [Pseudooceanicola sp. HF7]NIZ09722.1 flagellar biosynthesis protein FlhA [Pseudooceanicola sp. HF7]
MTESESRPLFQPTILLALALMSIIIMMILPVPAFVLDVGLAASFALAILIFTVTLFIEKPLDFSAFPTVLLASLMLRLSLNVSSTKLIIGQGHTGTAAAGDVIQGFADFVMSGSVFLGLVVFGVLLIVNFMVITKGAARMAEVGARFALDGMPGKQLAIDSDMSAGAINHVQAKERREREQLETTFFGSLDGASKFVKGDAVAGLLITILNLVVGLAMGVIVHGMALGDAFETYAILTVGDGLVTQIPAVIISIASALLLARGGSTGATDLALVSQLGRHPAALITVAVLMFLFGFVPGLPFVPFVIGGATLALAGYLVRRRLASEARDKAAAETPAPEMPSRSLGDTLDLDDIHVEFAPDLVNMVLDPGTGLDARIENMRLHVAESFGLILPEIRLTDDPSLPPGSYVIRIQGVEQARAVLRPDRVLALTQGNSAGLPPGEEVKEPVYGAPARWIDEVAQEGAALSGMTLVTPTEVLATHLLETIKRNFSRLLTMKSLRRVLEEMVNLSDERRAEANRKLLDELIPEKVPMDLLHQVLRLLVAEQVSIRNMPLILESVAEIRPHMPQPEAICEHVRHRLGFQIISELRREDGTTPLIQLAPGWEETFAAYQLDRDRGSVDIALPPEIFNRLVTNVAEAVSEASDKGIHAGIVTSTQRRRFLRMALSARGIVNPVLSFEEIGIDANPSLVAMVSDE